MNNTARAIPLITDDDITAFYSQVFNQCHRHLRDYHDAEEATQQTMIQACKNKLSFKGDSKLNCWLFRIAYNECNMVIRKNNMLYKKKAALHNLKMPDRNDPAYRDPFIIESLQNNFNSLKPREKESVFISCFTPFSKTENRSRNSIKSDLFRVRQKFLEKLFT